MRCTGSKSSFSQAYASPLRLPTLTFLAGFLLWESHEMLSCSVASATAPSSPVKGTRLEGMMTTVYSLTIPRVLQEIYALPRKLSHLEKAPCQAPCIAASARRLPPRVFLDYPRYLDQFRYNQCLYPALARCLLQQQALSPGFGCTRWRIRVKLRATSPP